MLTRIIILVLIAGALAAALLASQWRRVPLHVSGFVEAHEIRMGSRVGGRVRQVKAEEGAAVHKGDELLGLEPYDLMERQAEARAQLAAKQAELDRLSAGYRPEEIAQAEQRRNAIAQKVERLVAGPRKQEISTAEARYALAQQQEKLAQANFDRVKSLYAQRAASQDDMDRATDVLQAATATLRVRREELDLLKEGTRKEEIAEAKAQLAEAEEALALLKKGYRAEDIAEAKAAVAAAEAALRAIDRQIDELLVRAPTDGVVEAVELRPGDLIAPGAPALSLLDTSELWVRAYVPENRMDLRDNQPVRVTVDSLPHRSFAGRITFVARQAEFTPNNVQTPEERSKQVFRIKVTLDEGRDILRPGMSADVWLEGHR